MFPLKDNDNAEDIACWERPPRKYVLGEDVPWVRSTSTVSPDINFAYADFIATRRCKTNLRFLDNSGRRSSNVASAGRLDYLLSTLILQRPVELQIPTVSWTDASQEARRASPREREG